MGSVAAGQTPRGAVLVVLFRRQIRATSRSRNSAQAPRTVSVFRCCRVGPGASVVSRAPRCTVRGLVELGGSRREERRLNSMRKGCRGFLPGAIDGSPGVTSPAALDFASAGGRQGIGFQSPGRRPLQVGLRQPGIAAAFQPLSITDSSVHPARPLPNDRQHCGLFSFP